LLSKRRAHYLSLGFRAEDGRQEALLLRVDKAAIRPVLLSLAARTGLRITYLDDEARRSGQG